MYLNEAKASAVMESSGIDGLIVTAEANLRYVSGFGGTGHPMETFAVLPRSPSIPPTLGAGHRALVLLAANPTWMSNLVTYEQMQFANVFPQPGGSPDELLPITPEIDAELRRLLKEARKTGSDNPVESLARTLRELRLDRARLGFDDMYLAHRLREEHLRDLRIAPARETMFRIRLVKTAEELANVRRAAEVNQAAFQEAVAAVGDGVDTADVVAAFASAALRMGAAPAWQGFLTGPFETVGWNQLHKILRRGDVLPAGGLTAYNSYHSDIGRSIVVGPSTPALRRAHGVVRAAFDGLSPHIRPGAATGELFESVMEGAGRAGGDENRLGVYCHSIGLEVLELPHPVRHDPEREGFVLAPDVTFCVFVMYRSPETGHVVSAEEQYIVTETGCESLCELPLELIEAG